MSDIEKLSVFDGRIVQQRPAFAVDKGALSLTNSPFNAIAATSSQMTFNVQVPSLNVFMDRQVEWRTGLDMRMDVAVAGVNGAPAVANTPVVIFGRDCALAPYPLQSLLSTTTATINDTTVTLNTSDVLYEVLRLIDRKHNRLAKTTPSMLDKYQAYNNAVGAINNPISGYFDATDYDNVPNGAFYDIVFTDANGVALLGNGSYADGLNATPIDFVNGVPVLTNAAAPDPNIGNALPAYRIYFRFVATENLVLSPFIFNDECGDKVGLFGVNNVQFVFNFQQASRLIRNAPVAAGANTRTITGTQYRSNAPWVSPRINVQFLTPSLDIALPPKSVVQYLEYPRYLTNYSGVNIASNTTTTLQSQTITLPQIPDMLVIYVKPSIPPPSTSGDFYLPITRISVNFDNFAGLLSSHTTQQLYQMSVDNGLHMDWNTWSGLGRVVNTTPQAAFATQNANNAPLVGGFLVLRMGKDITLQAGQAPSVVGNYTLQFNFDCYNQTVGAVNPTLYVMTVNSGFFETQQGSSRIIKGVLTEQEVISAPPAPVGARGDLERLVGGGFMSKLGTALSKAAGMLGRSDVRDMLKKGAMASGIPMLQQGARMAEKVGLGVAGGAVTGGRRHGGRKAHLAALM
jgi:hypothetical protein